MGLPDSIYHCTNKKVKLGRITNPGVTSSLDDAQTCHHVPCTLLCPIVAIDYSLVTHHFLPMICQILRPVLAFFESNFLTHSQHQSHTRWVLFPTEFSEYLIAGKWFGQAVDADIMEIEDVKFDMFSETTGGKVVVGEDIWPGESFRQSIQDWSTHASFTHLLIFFPAFCSADKVDMPPIGSGNAGVSTKTTSRESSNVHRTYASSVVQGDNKALTPSFSSAAMFINLSPMWECHLWFHNLHSLSSSLLQLVQ